mgnify:FL=1
MTARRAFIITAFLAAAVMATAPVTPAAGRGRGGVGGDAGRNAAGKVVAITNVRIVPVVGAEVPKGTIVVKDGLIAEIGAGVAVPAGAEIVDAAGLRAYPGMIDSYSSLGLVEISGVAATVDNRETGRLNPQDLALEAVRYD